MEIPDDIQIKSTIRLGSVYYFPEDTFSSPEPHYFIVLNTDPLSDTIIFLVCASSKIDNVKRRRMTCPGDTLIEITPEQYPHFKFDTIIDCNSVMEKTIDQLVEKLSQGTLEMKTEMDVSIVEQLRAGVLNSPVVERRIKLLL